MPCDQAGGREVHRLLRGATLPVDGHTGDRLRPAGREDGGAGDVVRLLGDLAHASPHHVVDDNGVDPRALRQPGEDVRREVGGMNAREGSVALARGGANRLDDDCISHESPSVDRSYGQ